MALLRPRNLLLLSALLLAGALALIVVLRYRPAAEIADVVKALPTGVDLALQQINYTHSERGTPRWRLVASRVEHRSAENLTAVKDLQLTFFAADGTEQGALTARNGQVNNDFTVIEVQGEVNIVNRNGYRLQTDRLIYRQVDRSLATDAPVSLTADGVQCDGVGMHLDLETRRLRILSAARALLQPKRSQGKSS
jgi:LPS export ABC transporter protein LptC